MKKTTVKTTSKRVLYGVMAMAMTLAYFPMIASASPITNRKVTMGSSASNAVTSYNFTFTLPSAATIQSVKIQACDTIASCTQTGNANGFSSTAATINGSPTGLGSAGTWSNDVADTTSLRIKNTTNAGSPGAVDLKFNSVHNPSAVNANYFLKITTYTGADWTTGLTDTGYIAVSTAGIVTVNAVIDETLTFTLGNTTVDLGTITPAAYGKGSSTMTVGTNATTGYSLSYTGSTLTTTGGKVIDAMASKAALGALGSSKQFGINLALNTTPGVGAAVSGAGSGAATTNYITPNSYMFNTAGDVVATATAATNNNVFTTSYVSNITTDTAAGAYTTAINYVATANF